MQICTGCGAEFPVAAIEHGVRVDLRGRKRCLSCLPYRRLTRARKPVARRITLKTCAPCGGSFPARMVIDGRLRYLYRRRFCLTCSPFGAHNTSRTPPGTGVGGDLAEYRRKRRNAKTYRWQKKSRSERKRQLAAERGGKCEDCGYSGVMAALEFHHRDRASKEFGLGRFTGSLTRLRAEAAKCDLVCANCHRLRHLLREESSAVDPVVKHRRERKLRAVAYMGSTCHACGRDGPASLFEFHHWDASQKDFGLSESGIPRSWAKTVAELAKCVLLCANCHREVHAGVRELDEGLLGLAEDSLPYVA